MIAGREGGGRRKDAEDEEETTPEPDEALDWKSNEDWKEQEAVVMIKEAEEEVEDDDNDDEEDEPNWCELWICCCWSDLALKEKLRWLAWLEEAGVEGWLASLLAWEAEEREGVTPILRGDEARERGDVAHELALGKGPPRRLLPAAVVDVEEVTFGPFTGENTSVILWETKSNKQTKEAVKQTSKETNRKTKEKRKKQKQTRAKQTTQ